MSKLTVNHDLYGLGESQFVLQDSHGMDRIALHPWDRSGYGGRPFKAVAISLGLLNKRGNPKKLTKKMKKQGYTEDNLYWISIFDREKFVEGLLEVFPELQRNPVST